MLTYLYQLQKITSHTDSSFASCWDAVCSNPPHRHRSVWSHLSQTRLSALCLWVSWNPISIAASHFSLIFPDASSDQLLSLGRFLLFSASPHSAIEFYQLPLRLNPLPLTHARFCLCFTSQIPSWWRFGPQHPTLSATMLVTVFCLFFP